MAEFWRIFLYICGGVIFTASVTDSGYRLYKYLKRGRTSVGKSFDNKVKRILADDRVHNCPWILNVEHESAARERELNLLKETIITQLEPIKKDISEIKDLNKKLYHAQMTDLQIKLSTLFHEKFDVKGSLTKTEQTNWDKWFSDYHSLGGNSDIKRMDDLIQKARTHAALDKAKNSKRTKNTEEENKNEN